MAYCRFEDDSDLYIYHSVDTTVTPPRLCWTVALPDGYPTRIFYTRNGVLEYLEMLKHTTTFKIPDRAIERLKKENETNP